jgi:predicted GNAT family N-acyltransferase
MVNKGPQAFTPQEFQEVIISLGWKTKEEMSLNGLTLALSSSTQLYCVRDTNNQIQALARVLSDHYIFSTIPEVMVLPSAQRIGLGTEIVREIIKDFGHTIIFLGAQEGNESFFEKFGFVKGPQSYTKQFTKKC